MAKSKVTKTFSSGVDRSVSRSMLDDQTARSVQGCTQREIGRYTSCWEGRSKDSVNGVPSDFPALSKISDGDLREILGSKLYTWWDPSDPAFVDFGTSYDDFFDKAGGGIDMKDISGPEATKVTVNGRDAALFNAGDVYTGPQGGFPGGGDARFNDIENANGLAFWAVIDRAVLAADKNFLRIAWSTATGDPELVLRYDVTGGNGLIFETIDSGGSSTIRVIESFLTLFSPLSVFGLYIKPGTLDADLYVDGVIVTSFTLTEMLGEFVGKTINIIYLGDMDCTLGDMIFTSGDLTSDQIGYLNIYLNKKWAVHSNTISVSEQYERPPWRVSYWPAASRLISSSTRAGASAAGSEAYLYNGRTNDSAVQMHDYGDYRIFCADGSIIRAVHKDRAAEANEGFGSLSVTVYANILGVLDPQTAVAGSGIFLSHEYEDTGEVTTTAGNSSLAGTGTLFRSGSGWNRSGATFDLGVGQIHISCSSSGMPFRSLPDRGYFFVSGLDNALLLADLADHTQDEVNYRAAVPGQWAMGRFPDTYRGRFTYIEGREFLTGYLYDGSGFGISSVSTDYVQIGADLRPNDIKIGSKLIIDDAAIIDPILQSLSPAREEFEITGLDYTGTATRIYLDGTPSGGRPNWWVQSRLTAQERRYIWDTGRPADPTRNIKDRDDEDFLFTDPDNFTPWGDDVDGDCTARLQLGEARELLSQERALYVRQGEPPIDGIAPPGYGVTLLRRGVGIRNDACWSYAETREKVYFNSGVDDRMYVLFGNSTQQIDDKVVDDPNYTGKFSHVVYSDDYLHCLDTESAVPKIWMFNTKSSKWIGFTIRQSVGTDQLGTGTAIKPGLGLILTRQDSTAYVADDMIAVDGVLYVCTTGGISDAAAPLFPTTNGATVNDGTVVWTCYTTNPLYDIAQDGHGGIFAPFTDEEERSRLLVVYRDANSNFSLRTMNHDPDFHQDARLRHSAKILPSLSTVGGQPLKLRDCQVTSHEVIYEDVDAGTPVSYDRRFFSVTESEGEDTKGTYQNPDWADAQQETETHDFYDQDVSRGNPNLGVQLGDGIGPIGAVEVLNIEMIVKQGRSSG